jgi:hypothetical protein
VIAKGSSTGEPSAGYTTEIADLRGKREDAIASAHSLKAEDSFSGG